MKKEQTINILFTGLLIAVFISGIFITGYFFGLNRRLLETKADLDNFEEGYKTALVELKDFGVPSLAQNFSISGTITKINDNSFEMQIDSSPFLKFTPQKRTVKIDENTKIVKNESKDDSTYQKEFQEYNEKMKNSDNQKNSIISMPTIPIWYNEIKISYNDLKENSQVYIQTDYDLTSLETINAQKITLVK